METAVVVLRIAARILSIHFVALMAAFSHWDHEVAEADDEPTRNAWLAAGIAAAAALAGSFGNPIVTSVAVAAPAVVYGFLTHGEVDRIDDACVAVFGAFGLHLMAMPLAGNPFIWGIGETVAAIISVIAIGVVVGFRVYYLKTRDNDNDNDDEDEQSDIVTDDEEEPVLDGNPFVLWTWIAMVAAVLALAVLAYCMTKL